MPTVGERRHWSIDHDTGLQRPHFGNALCAALESWAPGTAHDGAVRRYEVLPNFAAGWHQAWLDGDGALPIGSAEIVRSPEASGGAHYRVTHDNVTSGEQVTLDFRTTGDPLPRLAGPWSVTTTNAAGDQYSGIKVAGSTVMEAGRRVIALTINGIELRTGELGPALPLTSWWTLFDALPSIVAGAPELEPFAVLEDLEKLRAPCTVRVLAGGPIEVAGHRLRGFCQHGAGMLPSYWWLDERGTACVVRSMFHTLVLRGPGAEDGS